MSKGYKTIPDSWGLRPITEVVTQPKRESFNPVQRRFYKQAGKLPVVDQGQSLITGYTDELNAAYRGTLPIIVFGDHTRILKFIDFPFVVGADGTQLLQSATNELENRFLYYALCAIPITNLGYSRHFKLLKEQSIPLPPLPEQRKIAAILTSVDDAIEKSSAVIDQLEVVKKALMQELLTRGLPGRHTRFKQTEIGEIPVEWEIVNLEALCSHVIDCPHDTPQYSHNGIPVIRTSDLDSGRIKLELAKRVDEATYLKRIRRLKPQTNDIFYAREGRFGVAAPVPAQSKICLGQRMMHLRASPETSPSYLCWAINSPIVFQQAFDKAGGSTTPHVNVGDVKKFKIPRPHISEQQIIGDFLDNISSLIFDNKKSLNCLRELKSSLLSTLLSGEVRVPLDKDAA